MAREHESAREVALHASRLAKRGALDEAEKGACRALELDAGCVEAWVCLGGVHMARWDFAKCIEANQKAADCDPTSVPAAFNQGLGHLYRGESPDMLACFRRVIELDPDNAAGHYYLAVAYNALGQKRDAQTSLDEAMRRGFRPPPEFLKLLGLGPDTSTKDSKGGK